MTATSLNPFFSQEQADALARLAALDNDRPPGPASPQPQLGETPPSLPQSDREKKEATTNERTALATTKGKRRADPLPVQTSLPRRLKLQVIEKLATFHDFKEVNAWLAEEHGVQLDRRIVHRWNLDHSDCRLSETDRAFFASVRNAYVSDRSKVALAHQVHRLKLVEKLVEKATNSKDYGAALKGLELAAKEMGGVLEGRTTVTHQGAVAHVHGTTEDLRAELAMRLAAMADSLPAGGNDTGALLPPATVTVDSVATEGEGG